MNPPAIVHPKNGPISKIGPFLLKKLSLAIYAIQVFYALQAWLPGSKALTATLSLAFMALIIGGVLTARRFTDQLKSRLTYPRAGYVAFQRPMGKRRKRVILFALLFGAVFGLMMSVLRGEVYWTPAALGGIFAAVWAYYGYQSGIARFYLLAVLMGAAGLGVAWLAAEQPVALLIFYAACSLGMLLSGGLTLLRFLQTHPVQSELNDTQGGA